MKATALNLLAIMLFFKNTNTVGAGVRYTGGSNRTMSSPFSTRVTPSDISCGTICHFEVACLGFSFVKATNKCKLYDRHPANLSAVVTTSAGEDFYALLCESGWRLFGDSCYLFSQDLRSWEASKVYCESINANLVKVETDVEHQFIRQTLSSMTVGYSWIGARYNSSVNEYRWTDGTSLSFNGWMPGRPGATIGCVDYLLQFGWLWNAYPDCVVLQLPFICEKLKN